MPSGERGGDAHREGSTKKGETFFAKKGWTPAGTLKKEKRGDQEGKMRGQEGGRDRKKGPVRGERMQAGVKKGGSERAGKEGDDEGGRRERRGVTRNRGGGWEG